MKLFRLSAFLTTFSTLLCLLLWSSSTSTAHAKKFATVNFVVKNHDHHDLAVKNVDTLPQASFLTCGGAGSGATATVVQPSFEVTLSHYVDIAASLLMVGFMYFWGRSLDAEKATPPRYPFFAENVLKEGFCNKDENTQLRCFFIDMFMVVISYLGARSKGLTQNPNFIGAAAYTIFHGIVHLSVQLAPSISTGPLVPATLPLLAIILAFVPLGVANVLNMAPKTKDFKFKTPVAVMIWLVATWGYGFIFNRREYALTYINVTIFLVVYGLRALLIGTKTEEDIKARENFVETFFPNFWFGQLATICVFFIMCSEPLACNGWFGNGGGHVLFEVALYTYLMSTVFG